jgi:hypothetical protein
MPVTVETDVCSGIDYPEREFRPECITVTANDYHVVLRDGEITVETSATSGWSPIARTVPVGVDHDEHDVPVLGGRCVRTWRPDDDSVSFEFVRNESAHHIVTRITVSSRGPLLRIHATDGIVGEASVGRFGVVWEYLSGPIDGSRPDFVFTPGLRPNPDQLIGQHMFRSPAAIVQHQEVSVALVPDVDMIEAHQPLGMFLDLQCPDGQPGRAVKLETGVAAYRLDGHVYFTTEGVEPITLRDTVLRFGCSLHVDAMAVERRGHQSISRYHWRRYGRKRIRNDLGPQVVPFRRYFDYGYDFAERDLWRESEVDGCRVGAMLSNREYDGDVWFQGWFNQLRSAHGYYAWARRTGDSERILRALATRDLVLSAPQPSDGPASGLFPTIAILPQPDTGGSVDWVESTLQGGGPGVYHLLDSSWTAWWLLRFHADHVSDVRTIDFCRRYADALVRLQNRGGGWPDYVDASTGETVTEYDPTPFAPQTNSDYVKGMVDAWGTKRLATSAESATNILFLAAFSRYAGDDDSYLKAARRGVNFLRKHVIPEHKWFDWETFFSCSPKPIDFYDSVSAQHPQNTMSLFFAAEAFRELYEITGEAAFGEEAVSLTDYMCLYQQVWSPPFLTLEGFGGFGVMNTDGEWNDARQAVFADGLGMQYLQSGRREYLERALAATRASFACTFMPENAAVAPKIFDREPTGYADENYAHGGEDIAAGASGFDWGTGSGLTAAARMLDLFGDLWIDVEGGWALGIDAIVVTECSSNGSVWHLTTHAPFAHTDTVTVKGSPADYNSGIHLVVNGLDTVEVSDDELLAGVEVRLR